MRIINIVSIKYIDNELFKLINTTKKALDTLVIDFKNRVIEKLVYQTKYTEKNKEYVHNYNATRFTIPVILNNKIAYYVVNEITDNSFRNKIGVYKINENKMYAQNTVGGTKMFKNLVLNGLKQLILNNLINI